MKFPREIKEIKELTPSHVIGNCIAYIPKLGGPQKTPGEPLLSKGAVDGWKASRLSYSINISTLPKTPETLKEGIVCHHCDNAWCINPDHLYLGTASQNTKDIYERNLLVRKRMSEARKGNQNAKGNKFSKELRAHLSERKKGNSNRKGKLKGQVNKQGNIIGHTKRTS